MRRRPWVLVCAFIAACTNTSSPTTTDVVTTEVVLTTAPIVSTTNTVAPRGPEPSVFDSTVDAITQSLLVHQPELVTELGADELIGFDASYLLSDLSPRGRTALADAAVAGLATLGSAEASFGDDERLSAAILRWHLEDTITMSGYADYENPVNFITGPHAGFREFMADVHPIETERDAEAYVNRLIAFRVQVGDLIEELQRLDQAGMVPTERSLDIARYQIGAAIGGGDAELHPLVTDLKARVEALSGERRSWAAGVGAQAEAAVRNVFSILKDLDAAIGQIEGRSDETPGMLHLPGGTEYYASVLRHYLSIDMTPQDVHEAGIAQVDRVKAELTVALEGLGYGAEEEFAAAVRAAGKEAGAMPTTSEPERSAVLERVTNTVDQAIAVFDDMFTVKPDTELQVVRPRPGREGGSGAYYRPPPTDSSRPGVYYLSLGGAEFGTLTMDTTTYHEAIPGHHFQLSVQRSLETLPLHQRVFDFTGYVEGWALYAERLAAEVGLYDDDPLGNVGRLQMELLRAARMVVDTGIHWLGWSRTDAIDYMTALGFESARATAEVDRYIVWPGQAPAYMVGMLEILRLRDEAKDQLGDRFDLVGFHDALLGQGSVPLALLDDVVAAWIADVG